MATSWDAYQEGLVDKAGQFREQRTSWVGTEDELERVLDEQGGFIYAHWDVSAETEAQIKADTKATIRCIPLDAPEEDGVDLISGKRSKRRVVFAKAY